jgi:ribonuclease D
MEILTRPGDLSSFCRRAVRTGSLALDTEFERERTYKPVLQLVQAATREEAVIIDPLALPDLGALWDLVADPSMETILHAAGQDMEIFYEKTRTVPRNLFDTQVAGALLGMGEQPGYADLLRRVLDVRLKKHERITDWGRRPLSDAQLAYALDDVVHLHPLRDVLASRLEERGRRGWLTEELAHYESVDHYEVDHRRLWLRVSRHRSLDRRGLAVLRELADWRERTAARRDIPRNRVVQDEMLVEIARRQPERPEDLKALRRLHPKEIARSGEEIVEAVARGQAVPKNELPVLPRIPEEDPELNVTADLLAVLLRHLARGASIATSYLATKKDLVRLIQHLRNGADDDPPRILAGWRHELAGRTLVRLLEGELCLRVDAATGRVRIEEAPGS